MNSSELREIALTTLSQLGRMPTTSYYEQPAAAYLLSRCESFGLEVQEDAWGNVLASRPGSEPGAPGIAFVAHMDHPGFEAVAEQDGHVVARVLGGVPPWAEELGAPVLALVRDPDEPDIQRAHVDRIRGRIVGKAEGTTERSVFIRFDEPLPGLPVPIVFDLPDFDLGDGLIRMRAADDLAGCATVMAVMAAAAEFESPGTVYGLFTRAEEVGLIGALLAAEGGLLPRDTVVVSVETSLALPGAEQGNGPVIRTGDRATTFDNAAEAYLVAARAKLLAEDKDFKVQRQLMGAGGCEASAFSAHGYSVTGMAYPLGAWHNAGPNNTIESEYISLDDFAGGVILATEAAKLAGTNPASPATTRLRQPVGVRERHCLRAP
jgi:putative aminopeptidase FrvX